MPFFQIKNSFLCQNWWTKSFRVFGAFRNSELKLTDFKEISKFDCTLFCLAELEILKNQLAYQDYQGN